ncbi:MAG: helix-turn-helix transcriptional regulator [Rivularia sp. (in: Bacteria)]|nr:helix-turn-helix transcriptional regulator [Rivularia sp. MS3]
MKKQVAAYKSDISVLDNPTGKIREQICNDAIVTLSSKVQHWKGLRVEQQYLPVSETPEMTSIGHLLCVHLSKALWVDYQQNSKWHNCLMKPGDLFLIPDGASHAARWQEAGELLVIALEPDLINQVAPEASKGKNIEIIGAQAQSDGLIANIALAFKEELETGGSGGELYRDTLTNALVARLLRNYSASFAVDETKGGLGKRKLKLVMDYIQAHITEEITLAQMAEIAGLSPFHFSRIFKESVGVSPNRYVNQCRVEKAKRLLEQQQISINQISAACGYSNPSYFIRQFRKVMGVTPKVYQCNG